MADMEIRYSEMPGGDDNYVDQLDRIFENTSKDYVAIATSDDTKSILLYLLKYNNLSMPPLPRIQSVVDTLVNGHALRRSI